MKRILLYTSMILLFLACSPEDGTDGLNGTNGIDGIDGLDGTDGESGTANVIYSDWFPSQFPNNIPLSEDDFIVDAPDLTEDILDTALLLVFGRTINIINEEFVEQLPRTVFFRNQYHYFRYQSNPEPSNSQQFSIIIESTDGGFIGIPFFDEYRYFIIPGGIPTSGKDSSVDYSKMSYEEIIAHFNIPE